MMLKTLSLTGVLLTLAIGCSTSGHGRTARNEAVALTGREWTVVSLQGNAIVAQRPPTLRFDQDSRVSGFGGINRISGAYTREGRSHLSFGQMISTRMAGDPTMMRMEQTLLAAIQSVDGYKLKGNELTLMNKDVVVAVLRASDSSDSLPTTRPQSG